MACCWATPPTWCGPTPRGTTLSHGSVPPRAGSSSGSGATSGARGRRTPRCWSAGWSCPRRPWSDGSARGRGSRRPRWPPGWCSAAPASTARPRRCATGWRPATCPAPVRRSAGSSGAPPRGSTGPAWRARRWSRSPRTPPTPWSARWSGVRRWVCPGCWVTAPPTPSTPWSAIARRATAGSAGPPPGSTTCSGCPGPAWPPAWPPRSARTLVGRCGPGAATRPLTPAPTRGRSRRRSPARWG